MRKILWPLLSVSIFSTGCVRTLPGDMDQADSAASALLLTHLTRNSATLLNAGSAAVPSCASNAFCYTFRTNGLASANVGGIAGADAVCNSDANKPGSATGSFKALLVDPQTNLRRASVTANVGDGQIDWVLQAAVQYRRSDGITIVGTTNAARLFAFALTNGFTSSAGGHWSGMTTTWINDANHCNGWTSTAGSGRDGADNAATSAAISNNLTPCNTTGPTLICIEQ